MKNWLSLLCLVGILFAFTAKVHADGTYLVIDLETWQYRYTDDDPDLTKDTCRKTELWLRYIPAGEFTMGSPTGELGRYSDETQHRVTLTKPFYIGVFECTQAQWEYVMGEGNRPSWFNNNDDYATRPVEQVSYNMIRGTGAQAGAGWPKYGHVVDASSFMGKLQSKTGLVFDLPTEAQWEYACRAGTKTALNSNENLENTEEDANMAVVGRYLYNGGEEGWEDSKCDTTAGTAKVGSYKPNNWGLYDMHGNVYERCLDLWDGLSAYDSADATDPAGDAKGSTHAIRGGAWSYSAYRCRSASRSFFGPSYQSNGIGFRIVFLPTYAVTVVNGTADKAEAVAGDTVTITADEPPSGKVFDCWTGSVLVANATATETTFVMPAHAVTVTANYYKKGTRYLVIYDLDKEKSQYRYTDDDPDLDDDTCRTTELWLRYIPEGTFMMGSPEDELGRWNDETQHKVTLTKPFYIGVFECTQAQWEYVMGEGNRPSYFNNNYYYATRPVEEVSYNMIRGTGAQAGAGWPTYGHAVDATSFMGVLRHKTGLMFDLPTEAQWEYACRAGTTTALNSNENLENTEEDANMSEVGRYYLNGGVEGYNNQNCSTAAGTAKAGSYLANNWGLYDMHGNVLEWCLDWWDGSAYDSADATNPAGNATGTTRVIRGGSWSSGTAPRCRSAFRSFISPSSGRSHIGFRVVFLPPDAYSVTVVKGTADKSEAIAGDTVAITANMPASGQTFDKWTGNVEFANETAPETTFEMPANAVTVTATYKAVAKKYTVTAVNGTANKVEAAAGEIVTVFADEPPEHEKLYKWTYTGTPRNVKSSSVKLTFVMPANDVTVTAVFKALPQYKVTVTNGTADKAKAYAGETVTITANAPAAGRAFDKWSSSTAACEDKNAATTTFVMPAKAVTVKAYYKAAP